ncbi:MAG: hypothetical protein LBK76_06860 [Verrucomicrobiales bacterium]|jgi:hypothetical protein|nr:hypothetical protein [Verrucomicrobiales bacterium]
MAKLKTRKAKKHPGVCRIDQPQKHNHGYYVRLTRNGKRFAKFFSDRTHGGKENALVVAVEYYAGLDQKYARMPRKAFAQIARRKNKTGILGVSKITKDVKGRVYSFWQATWSPVPGEVAKKAFSIKKYGDEKAKQLAIKARKKGVSEMAD